MRLFFSQLWFLFTRRWIFLLYIAGVVASYFLWRHFTDTDFIKLSIGNEGKWHTYIDIALSLLTILIFPLFIIAWIYRSVYFGKFNKTNTSERAGFLGGVVGVVISGSSCCGLTLASYLGLLPLLTFLPFSGLEVKVIAVASLVYAAWSMITKLTSCSMKSPAKKQK